MLLRNKRNLIIAGVVVICLIIVTVFFIFTGGKNADDYVEDYFALLEDKDYSKLYQYSVTCYTTGGKYIEGSFIDIEFSKNEILHCLYYNMEEVEESIINNVPVKIFAHEEKQDKSKIGGYASFKYNDYNVDIEVNMITLEDFIKVIRSIIK